MSHSAARIHCYTHQCIYTPSINKNIQYVTPFPSVSRAFHPTSIGVSSRSTTTLGLRYHPPNHCRRLSNQHRRSRSSSAIQCSAISTIAPTAAHAATSLFSFIRASIDPGVFAATATASYKLFLVCLTVGWLFKTNRIPPPTASVLSQVSFQLLIPCMLFSKVAATLAASPDPLFLLAISLAAVTQVAVGAFWGALLSPLLDGPPSISRSISIPFLGERQIALPLPFLRAPQAQPAVAIATATAAATGLPQATAALLPRPVPTPPGLKELIITACAFGNSFTLPAVFFMTLLPGALADQAIAYCGLFLMAWSPCLWSIGLNIVETGFRSSRNKSITSSTDSTISTTRISKRKRIATFVSRTLNPPILAILVGIATGLSPGGAALLRALRQGSSAVQGLPFELSLVWSGLCGAFDVVEMLAGGTLAVQTLVLASSLVGLQPPQAQPQQEQQQQSSRTTLLKSIIKALAPVDAMEARALGILSAVRFLLVPVTCLALWKTLTSALSTTMHMHLPAIAQYDALFLFVIAVQSVMPSAQNLIIMLQLSDVTRPAAPPFARMLLKLYAYAVLPVTLWVTAFASRLSIPLGVV